jgi:hypothetical protein
VLAFRAVRRAGAARPVDHQSSKESPGEDGDEELKRPDGAPARELDHVPGDGGKAGYCAARALARTLMLSCRSSAR